VPPAAFKGGPGPVPAQADADGYPTRLGPPPLPGAPPAPTGGPPIRVFAGGVERPPPYQWPAYDLPPDQQDRLQKIEQAQSAIRKDRTLDPPRRQQALAKLEQDARGIDPHGLYRNGAQPMSPVVKAISQRVFQDPRTGYAYVLQPNGKIDPIKPDRPAAEKAEKPAPGPFPPGRGLGEVWQEEVAGPHVWFTRDHQGNVKLLHDAQKSAPDKSAEALTAQQYGQLWAHVTQHLKDTDKDRKEPSDEAVQAVVQKIIDAHQGYRQSLGQPPAATGGRGGLSAELLARAKAGGSTPQPAPASGPDDYFQALAGQARVAGDQEGESAVALVRSMLQQWGNVSQMPEGSRQQYGRLAKLLQKYDPDIKVPDALTRGAPPAPPPNPYAGYQYNPMMPRRGAVYGR
jgi:hypothetical protein